MRIYKPNVIPDPIVRGCAGDDAVVVGRIPLRLHKAFASPIGTGVEVRVSGRFTIKCGNYGIDCSQMDGSVPVVNDFFWVVQSQGRAGAGIIRMAGIGGSGGVVVADRIRKRGEVNGPRKA